MRLTEVTYGLAKAIEGYGPGFFRVAGHILRGPCLITPWDAGPWGGFEDTAAPLSLLEKIDVLFVGTGSQVAHVPQAFRDALEGRGSGSRSWPRPPPPAPTTCFSAKGGGWRWHFCRLARARIPDQDFWQIPYSRNFDLTTTRAHAP